MEPHFSCAEVFQRLNDYLDRELSVEEMRLVTTHLATCLPCAAEHRFEAGLLTAMKDKLRRIEMPDEVRARLLAQLRPPV